MGDVVRVRDRGGVLLAEGTLEDLPVEEEVGLLDLAVVLAARVAAEVARATWRETVVSVSPSLLISSGREALDGDATDSGPRQGPITGGICDAGSVLVMVVLAAVVAMALALVVIGTRGDSAFGDSSTFGSIEAFVGFLSLSGFVPFCGLDAVVEADSVSPEEEVDAPEPGVTSKVCSSRRTAFGEMVSLTRTSHAGFCEAAVEGGALEPGLFFVLLFLLVVVVAVFRVDAEHTWLSSAEDDDCTETCSTVPNGVVALGREADEISAG
mmetsp:Transcript_1071/g.3310  ORF Transcript_1071/g.3310 Transcript_1071/m.3310 type:complete len:268 (+) Transcript_1071:1358-2161(+)